MILIARFDASKYSSEQMAKVHSIVVETLMDDEENQVRGYAHINDESGLTMSHLSAWSLTDIRNMLKCFTVAPMRHKNTHFVNIPSFGTKVIEFAVSLLSEKLRKRIMVMNVQIFVLKHFFIISRLICLSLNL